MRAVIADGETVTDVAARFGVSRKTVHVWLAKYEAGGLVGLADGSHRPRDSAETLHVEVLDLAIDVILTGRLPAKEISNARRDQRTLWAAAAR